MKGAKRMLMRDYIKRCLYDPQTGFFTNPDHNQLGKMPEPLKFEDFESRSVYMSALGKNYPSHKFLTPAEIYRPFYGMTIAHYLQKQYMEAGEDLPKFFGMLIFCLILSNLFFSKYLLYN